jgi:polysaccharide biosynthesis transport protein
MTPQNPRRRTVAVQDYFKILRKHRWLVLGLFLVTVLTVTVWAFRQTPIYEAAATVLIEPEAPRFINIQDVSPVGSPTQDYYQTQYQLIKSRPIADRVIEALNLQQRMPGLRASKDPAQTLLASTIIEPRRNTRLVLVKFESPDPALAADVANALAAQYAKYNLDIKLKGAQEALSWLTEQMSGLKAKVQESSTALQNYRVKAGILGLTEQRQITAAKIMDFNKAYLEAQAQRLTIEAKLRELTQIASSRAGAETILTVTDSPLIRTLRTQAADLQVLKSKLLSTYKAQHPEVLKVEAQIDQVQQKIDTEIQTLLRTVQTEYKVAKAREETLLGNVNQLRREGQDFNEKEIQYQVLQRDSDSNQQLFEAVLKRMKETGVTGGLEANNVRIVEAAVVPRAPVKPRRALSIVLSVIVGLAVGIGTAVAVEYMDRTLKTPDEVERHLGLPVIAIVPLFSARRSA